MKDKKSINGFGIIAVLVGLILSKFLGSYFGGNAQLMAMSICALITVLVIIIMIFQKYYLASLLMFILALPVFIGIVGAYLDNLYIMIGSIVAIFVVLFIIIKFLPKYKK